MPLNSGFAIMIGIGNRPKSRPRDIRWDNHACLALKQDSSQLNDILRYRDAGWDVVSVNVGYADMTADQIMSTLRFMKNAFAQRSEHLLVIRHAEDIFRCRAEGKLGIVFDIEGVNSVESTPRLTQSYYDLGVRWMSLAYNLNNGAGGGCLDDDQGLTSLGRSIIDEMERTGMLLCLSHTGRRTALEALEYSSQPVIFSHSNPSDLHSHRRNIDNDVICACAAQGGIIGLSGIGTYLGTDTSLIDALVSQIRYVSDLVGSAHVGLGLDYVSSLSELEADMIANPDRFPSDLAAVHGFSMIAPEERTCIGDKLRDAHFSSPEIDGILGMNWMRLAATVWR